MSERNQILLLSTHGEQGLEKKRKTTTILHTFGMLEMLTHFIGSCKWAYAALWIHLQTMHQRWEGEGEISQYHFPNYTTCVICAMISLHL